MKEKQLQLVTFEQALRLNEFGFFLEEYMFYDASNRCSNAFPFYEMSKIKFLNYLSAPTVALALKWCRDEKKLEFSVVPAGNGRYVYLIIPTQEEDIFDSYEAAESALLDELLTYLEKEKQ